MELYEIQTDHILVNEDQIISLNDGEVIGISVEVLATSGSALLYGLNEAPKIPVGIPSGPPPPRAYGGFNINNSGVYKGELRIKFDTNVTPQALVIITRFLPTPICT